MEKLPSAKILSEARDKWVQLNLEIPLPDPPDPETMEQVAEEFDIPIELLKSVAKNKNWNGMLNLRRSTWQEAKQKAEVKVYEERAVDIVRQQTEFLQASIDLVNEELPAMIAYIRSMRQEGMIPPKEAIMYAKLLVDERRNMMKMMAEIIKINEPEDGKATKEAEKLRTDITMRSQLLDATKEGAEEAPSLPDSEFAEAMKEIGEMVYEFGEPVQEGAGPDSARAANTGSVSEGKTSGRCDEGGSCGPNQT